MPCVRCQVSDVRIQKSGLQAPGVKSWDQESDVRPTGSRWRLVFLHHLMGNRKIRIRDGSIMVVWKYNIIPL